MLKKIGIALVVILGVMVGVIATRPDSFHVERSATAAAPAAVLADHVRDFHKWADWSPWAKLDPAMKTTYDGAAAGKGAIYSWVGNDKVGEGKMTVVEEKPGELVDIQLEFIKPFAATNDAAFHFAPDGASTKVTWTMDGKSNFMGKAMSLFMDMDKMIGGDFEKGLASLKTVSEADAKQRADAEAAHKAAMEAQAKAAAAQAAAAQAAAAQAAAAPPAPAKKKH